MQQSATVNAVLLKANWLEGGSQGGYFQQIPNGKLENNMDMCGEVKPNQIEYKEFNAWKAFKKDNHNFGGHVFNNISNWSFIIDVALIIEK